ncbi:Sensor histidine kinase RcsC [Planctomycetes bacterium Poly30]|uniref:histidine kinase n=1 Tax=Saltatorellus ferox TaxID=2528018 RepID=A0A518EMX8_9BACT|nr:Sensor histidine kinase RcsC [Planctomycetes bacterium Poly30]
MEPQEELRKLRLENEKLRQESQSIAIANVRAGLQMAEISSDREAQLKARQAELEAALDAARIAARQKDEFLAKVTHELRTPLNGSIGMMQLLLDSSLTEGQRECASVALQSSTELLGLINMILDASAIRAGRVNLTTTEFDPWSVVHAVAKTLAVEARRKDLGLHIEIDPRVPRGVTGDPDRVRQVLLNLVGNALKFTDKGGVRIRVRPRLHRDGRVETCFIVADSGCGMPEGAEQDLFDNFVQGDNSMARRFGGSGLGLSISRGIVESMGGQISVRSREGIGSAFRFRIPTPVTDPAHRHALPISRLLVLSRDPVVSRMVERHFRYHGVKVDVFEEENDAGIPSDARAACLLLQPTGMSPEALDACRRTLQARTGASKIVVVRSLGAEALGDNASLLAPLFMPEVEAALESLRPVSTEPNAVAAGGSLSGLRILVAEDHPVNQKVAQLHLKRLGAEAHLVEDGLLAVAAWEAGHFDAILMDCQMPNMDGNEATAKIRALEASRPGHPHTPILALTANTAPADRDRCFASGMDTVLGKPIDTAALAAAVLAQVPPRRPPSN